MEPAVDRSPLPADRLRSGVVVFDTVYNPVRTRLLQEVEQAGGIPVDGVEMFVGQAAEQYRIWTGREMDRAAAEGFIRGLLGGR
jgi:shikimate dehydrogenase